MCELNLGVIDEGTHQVDEDYQVEEILEGKVVSFFM